MEGDLQSGQETGPLAEPDGHFSTYTVGALPARCVLDTVKEVPCEHLDSWGSAQELMESKHRVWAGKRLRGKLQEGDSAAAQAASGPDQHVLLQGNFIRSD